MHLNGVPVMIEHHELNLINAAFSEGVVNLMMKNERTKSFNISAKDTESFLGSWDLEYSLPSIFQKEPYDIKCRFEYCGENSETRTNKISHYFFIFSTMNSFFKFIDFSSIRKFMKMSDSFYRAVSKSKKVKKFPPINIKVKLEGDNGPEIYTAFPIIYLKDDEVVLNSQEVFFKGNCFYITQDTNLRKYSIKYFPDYVRDVYTKQIISDINSIFSMDLSSDNLSHEEAEALIAQYTSVVEMMFT